MSFCSIAPLRIGDVSVPGFIAGNSLDPMITLGVWAFLVESDAGTILFDGGLVADAQVTHDHVRRTLGPEYGYKQADESALRKALFSLGVSPEDIDIAIVSHLHHDHAGAIGWLPRARIMIHADELETLRSPYAHQILPSWQVTPGTKTTLKKLDDQDRIHSWSGHSMKVSDAVELFLVGGHTMGSVALLGRDREERVVGLVGDLALTELHIEQGLIPATALNAYDTIRSLTALVGSTDVLWPGHAIEGSVPSTVSAAVWPSTPEWRLHG